MSEAGTPAPAVKDRRLWILMGCYVAILAAILAYAHIRTERVREDLRRDLESIQRTFDEAGLDRIQAAHQAREKELLARLAASEKELEGALATAARAVQDADAERRERALLEKRVEKEEAPPQPAAAEDKPAKPREQPSLAATAVTDPAQVRKLLDGLNTILALAEEKEAWSVASAEAVEGDRLVRVTVEARAAEGGLSRTYQAAEARFVLKGTTGTLEILLRDGKVTYPGERTVSFPEGRYSAVLTVDPAAVRNAGNPLVVVR